MTIRFDYQVGRATDPATVFTNLLLGFELQRGDRRYVGVNLVQPEDDPVALRDYTPADADDRLPAPRLSGHARDAARR